MPVQGISMGIWEIWVEIRKMLGIRVAMQGIQVETCNGNDKLKDWREVKVINLVSRV